MSRMQTASHGIVPSGKSYVHFQMAAYTMPLLETMSNPLGTQQVVTRDSRRCLVSNYGDPDACHIWPLSTNNTVERRDTTRAVLSQSPITLGPSLSHRMEHLLTPKTQKLASADKAWNMLTLCPTLRVSWDRVNFALRWAGVEADAIQEKAGYTTVILDWYWLPRSLSYVLQDHFVQDDTSPACKRALDLDTPGALDRLAQSLKGVVANSTSLSSRGTWAFDPIGRRMTCGRQVRFRVPSDQVDKMRDVIKAQWIVCRIAAFSGADKERGALSREPPLGVASDLKSAPSPGPDLPGQPSISSTSSDGNKKSGGCGLFGRFRRSKKNRDDAESESTGATQLDSCKSDA